MFHCPDAGRILTGDMSSPKGASYGAFFIRAPRERHGPPLKILADDGAGEVASGWEHVSVSLPHRCPTWSEMCFVRDLFWDPEACVLQFHPPRSEYVDLHPFCLHLWRPIGVAIALPPSLLV